MQNKETEQQYTASQQDVELHKQNRQAVTEQPIQMHKYILRNSLTDNNMTVSPFLTYMTVNCYDVRLKHAHAEDGLHNTCYVESVLRLHKDKDLNHPQFDGYFIPMFQGSDKWLVGIAVRLKKFHNRGFLWQVADASMLPFHLYTASKIEQNRR
jgi:hypothetical protein